MKTLPFYQRLSDILNSPNVNIIDVVSKGHVDFKTIRLARTGKYDTHYGTLEKLATAFDKIPIAFYTNNNRIENLGVSGFIYGEPVDNYVGKVFKKYRELRDLSEEELAQKAGINSKHYRRFESGLKKPSLVIIEKICAELGIVPQYLVDKAVPTEEWLVDKAFERVYQLLEARLDLSRKAVRRFTTNIDRVLLKVQSRMPG